MLKMQNLLNKSDERCVLQEFRVDLIRISILTIKTFNIYGVKIFGLLNYAYYLY